jgi:hypothetical protein
LETMAQTNQFEINIPLKWKKNTKKN